MTGAAAALAVDAGQTEIRAALIDEHGPHMATAPGVEKMGEDPLAGAGLLAELGPSLHPEPGILWREADGEAA